MIGVVGKGKTGAAVIETLGLDQTVVFSRSNPLRAKRLVGLESLIVFVPADALIEILPELLNSKIPVVCGTTGYPWKTEFADELKERQLTWVVANNFSPGMNFMFTVAGLLKASHDFLGNPRFKISDLHHVHKKDAPSGTALKLSEALGGGIEIHSTREGDHPGLHELETFFKYEKLNFIHEARDRRAFAEGAVYAAKKILPTLSSGLHFFEKLMQEKILNLKDEHEKH